mgnify:CR=1 FL=1
MTTNLPSLVEKWDFMINEENAEPIKDAYKRRVLARVFENMANEGLVSLKEDAPSTNTSQLALWDPLLMPLTRDVLPNLLPFELAGVQPLAQPTGLIHALRPYYNDNATHANRTPAFRNEANTGWSGDGTTGAGSAVDNIGEVVASNLLVAGEMYEIVSAGSDTFTSVGAANSNVGTVFVAGDAAAVGSHNSGAAGDGSLRVLLDDAFALGRGADTATAEAWDELDGSFKEMTMDVKQTSVTARSRGLAAGFSREFAQDLRNQHGVEAQSELANILRTEIIAEQNREFVQTILMKAKLGSLNATNPGRFSMTADADGRYEGEKEEALYKHVQREANVIGVETRRGRGNWVLASPDVATALNSAKLMTPANLNVDPTGNTFVGTLRDGKRVYVDPYATTNYVVVGYRGESPYDAGIFYCPYIPLEFLEADVSSNFQKRIGFKTRYGMVANPFVSGANSSTLGTNRANFYFRVSRVENIGVPT